MSADITLGYWFAWHPVCTEDTGWAWLRKVWRKSEYFGLMADCYKHTYWSVRP